MKVHEVRLTGSREVAADTMAFHLSRPDGFVFAAGQAIRVELIDPPAESGQGSRTFSLVSAPFEQELVVATRMRDSAFKRVLRTLPEGAKLRISGPFGKLATDGPGPSAVYIAGGIGIAPFMSLLRQAAHDASSQQLLLVYSNRRPEDAAFLDELRELESRNSNMRLMATMTDMGESARSWRGEVGHVDAHTLRRFVGELARPMYYLVGPPAMVAAMQWTLADAGVAPERVRTEAFYGYKGRLVPSA